MAVIAMRRVKEGEVPYDGGTAVQDDAHRPVFSGNGANDYACGECGNVLATGMDAEHMTYRVRVKCGRCRTVNVAPGDEGPRRRAPRAKPRPQLS